MDDGSREEIGNGLKRVYWFGENMVVAGIDEFSRWVHPESWVHLFQDGLEQSLLLLH
jgi:hypothetical protein